MPRPILGFHGLIADWVDLALIAEVARLQPTWSVVLVGRSNTDLTPLANLKNVHLLGHRLYARLPEYLHGFDVAILPFVLNALTEAANPLKLREYLAAGLPVIAAPLTEIKKMGDKVFLCSTAQEYVERVADLSAKGKLGPHRARSEGMRVESWDAKVKELEQLLEQVLRENQKSICAGVAAGWAGSAQSAS